ncbi:MAG: ATP-binding protein [Phycisphaerales bacterium]
MLILTVIQGPDKDRRFNLPDHEPQCIGRSSESLPLSDNAISRRHAELTPDDGLWYIDDLKSQNGTYVNGNRLTSRTRLHLGDQIRVGRTVLVFGQTDVLEPDIFRVVGNREMDSTVERTLQSSGGFTFGNDDSVVLAEPEPRAAAVDHLRIIYALTAMLTGGVRSRQEILSGVLNLVFAELHPERGCVMVCEDGASASPEHRVAAAVKYREMPLDREGARIDVSRTILQHALKNNEGVLSTNALTDPRFAKGDSVRQLNIRSALCSPIRYRDRVFGVIYIDSSLANYTFTAEQLALLNAIGQHTGLALANTEANDRRLQAERLAAIGETVATLSHSIKNILQGLRGGGDLLEMGLNKEDLKIASGGWVILRRNVDRVIGLTMNMLAFSRQRHAEFGLTQIAGLLDECASLVEAQCKAKKVALIVDCEPDIPPISIDASLVHQAVMNLLANAIEAVPQDAGAVTLRVSLRVGADAPNIRGECFSPSSEVDGIGDRPRLEITVADNGPGIPRSKLMWVFEPFNTTKGVRGTGLGLAVAKRVCDAHGGRILVESAEGRGCVFRMILPCAQHDTIDPSATSDERPGTSR